MPSLPLLLLLLLLWAVASRGFPAFSEAHLRDVEMVQRYLENYYSLKDESMLSQMMRGSGLVADKLKQMQQFFGLKVTGKSDPETLRVMVKPRCGVSDVAAGPYYTHFGTWGKTNLTYRVINYTPDLPIPVVDLAFEKAFQVWSNVASLTFSRVSEGEADIMISFVSGDHYDNNPFDGPGEKLAHAFQPGPRLGGDIHFDEDERWTNNNEEFNLYYVAAHEVGHSLGLAHSPYIGSLMYPSYTKFTGEVMLSQFDIDVIQALYGPSLNPVQPTSPQIPQACDRRLTFDAATTIRGDVMFFKDRFYLRKISFMREIELHYITTLWPHLPSRLDAAYEFTTEDEVRFFKGSRYWAVQGETPLAGYPRSIHHSFGFSRQVKHIDAAVYHEDTGKTYFFTDNMYWRYDEYQQSMDAGYPKFTAHDFPGIVRKVDAVFEKQGFFYFFHGAEQYKFNLQQKRIESYAKANRWFNC
uniref:interstitial collagenase n=1 Tax=Jaculus jaculus TaxID=51337 RepID=A0A8C5K593_JACJA